MCVLIFEFNLKILICNYLYIITNLLAMKLKDDWKNSKMSANSIQGEKNVEV